jgi:hypothetical protein
VVDIGAMFREGTPIDEAMRAARRAVVEKYRREGRPLVEWRNGRVVWVDPFTFEEVPRPDDFGGTTPHG